MIKHIVFTRFNNPEEDVPAVSAMLNALPAKIPQIVTLETGADFKHSERSFDLALIVTFHTVEDLATYDQHPEHLKVREYMKAHRSATATVDFEF